MRSIRLIAMLLSFIAQVARAEGEEIASALYVRADTNRTSVVSPRVRVRAPLAESTSFDVGYAVDIWTSASVDIVSAASAAVTEQRDEIDASLTQEWQQVIVSAAYRYSHEPDFISHGVSAGVAVDMADRCSTLALGVTASIDQVGRAGDLEFSRRATTLGMRAAFTQVLDENTLVQALYDLSSISGYQSSPYRFVPIGGELICAAGVTHCLPERSPEQRLRHAFALRGRRALGPEFSVGLGYRFYVDSWALSPTPARRISPGYPHPAPARASAFVPICSLARVITSRATSPTRSVQRASSPATRSCPRCPHNV